jgi:membrane fusion protein (multidrug efflux system)
VTVRPTLLLLALLPLAACGGKPAGSQGGGPGAGGPPVTAVEVAAAFTDTVVDAITATGEIDAEQQIELRPDIEGRIVALLFREGERVAQGDSLIKIDDAELRAQVDRARADRDLAQQALARTRQLLVDKAAAPADLERAEATARSTTATLDLLTVQLSRTVVRAPFAGVIGQRLVSLGDYVTTGSKLLTLQTVSPMRVMFNVPERYAAVLRVGQTVQFQVAALPGRTFEARVDFVDPVVTLPARTITVKGVTPNNSGELQAGMFIEARLETAIRPSATIVPEEAIVPSASASYVWVVTGDKVTRREVETGVRTPGFVEIRKGVEPGEQVVIGGVDRLFEGAPIKATVVNRQPVGAGEGQP